jgi:cytochrome c-type biogenesis protein
MQSNRVSPALRWRTFTHALAFVAGFSLVFVVLGASVAFFGFAFNRIMPAIVKIGGVVLILFGLYVTGALTWIGEQLRKKGWDRSVIGRGYLAFLNGLARLLYTEGRVQVRADRSLGYLSSFMMGVFFSAGWIPCIGPVLAGIYLLASDTETVAQGALLLLAYSAGLGIPFLLTGLAFSTMTGWLRRVNRHLAIVAKITGLFLIFMGILLYMDRLTFITGSIVSRFGTGLASLDLGGMGLSGAVTIPIAVLAGLLSFLSPCVLPLVPAYIGYLSGTAMADQRASA